MITGVHLDGFFRTASPPLPFPTHTLSLRLLSASIGRSVRIRQCLPSFYPPLFLLLCPSRFFFSAFGFVCGAGVYCEKKKKEADVMHCHIWVSPCFFFLLVTFVLLSHRHLALAALLPTRSSSSESSSEEPPSSAAAVAWSGPAPGDRFGSGDTIVGEWQVTPQNQKVVSPSFRLCMGGEDGCGATIWPEVVEESEGSYHVSLYVPMSTFSLLSSRKKKRI